MDSNCIPSVLVLPGFISQNKKEIAIAASICVPSLRKECTQQNPCHGSCHGSEGPAQLSTLEFKLGLGRSILLGSKRHGPRANSVSTDDQTCGNL